MLLVVQRVVPSGALMASVPLSVKVRVVLANPEVLVDQRTSV